MKVLVAVDGSANSLKAVQKAATLFSQGSLLTLINVQVDEHLRSLQGRVGKATVDGFITEQHDNDLKAAKAWLDQQGVKYDVIIAEGALAPTIAENAADGGFDMVAIGAKGRGSIGDLVMGSVVTRLIAASKVPVVVIP
jgi:nucleotide-binding universal stress UspA family protein